MQGRLIVFDRQDKIAFARHDGPGNLLLATPSVEGHDFLTQVQQCQQLWYGRDFIGFRLNGYLAESKAGLARPGTDDVQGPQALGGATGVTHGLAVEMNPLTRQSSSFQQP